MANKNFVVKNGLTAGSLVIDSNSSSISTTIQGASLTKINLRITTSDTGSLVIPVGTIAQRDASPIIGYLRYNTVSSNIEFYDGSSWIQAVKATSNTGSILLSSGTTLERDTSPGIGYLRYNTVSSNIEFYDGSSWIQAVKATSNTGSMSIPVGDTSQRDSSPVAGYFRFNTTKTKFEGYDGVDWVSVGDLEGAVLDGGMY